MMQVFNRSKQPGNMTISQEVRINKLLDRFNVTSTSPIPACPPTELRPRKGYEAETDEPFREAVDGLVWMANMTRWNTLTTVREVARHSHSLSNMHW